MIPIKSSKELRIMQEGGKILAETMKEVCRKVRPGITTRELNRVAETLLLKSGGRCSFKGYDGFPACLCTSLNEEVVHALPSTRVLKEGDVLSLDLGIFWKGFHCDMAETLPVGKVNAEAGRLIRVTKKSLKMAIRKVRPGNTFGDLGNTIQRYIESQGFSVIRDLCGHGIGRKLHEDPQILNYGKRKTGPRIEKGMVFCLEPMAAAGDWRIKRSADGCGFSTADNSLAVHFEHTVAVTAFGCKILTSLR